MKELRRTEIEDGLKIVVWNPTGGMDAVQTRKKRKGDMAERLKEQVRIAGELACYVLPSNPRATNVTIGVTNKNGNNTMFLIDDGIVT